MDTSHTPQRISYGITTSRNVKIDIPQLAEMLLTVLYHKLTLYGIYGHATITPEEYLSVATR